jgi:hypothetical protein
MLLGHPQDATSMSLTTALTVLLSQLDRVNSSAAANLSTRSLVVGVARKANNSVRCSRSAISITAQNKRTGQRARRFDQSSHNLLWNVEHNRNNVKCEKNKKVFSLSRVSTIFGRHFDA